MRTEERSTPTSGEPKWLVKIQPMQLSAILIALLVTIFLGCMSLSFGGRTYQSSGPGPDNVAVEEGKAVIPGNSEQDVYYPRPYAHTPNLELENTLLSAHIVDQKEDHFRVANTCALPVTVGWTARGVPATLPILANPPPAVPASNP